MQSSSTTQLAAAPARPAQKVWARRRRRRLESLPTQLLLVGMLCSVLALGSKKGFFVRERQASTAEAGRELADAGFTVREDVPGRRLGDHPVYQISELPYCPPDVKVGNSTYPALPFGEDEVAAATIFQLVIMCFMFLGLAIVCDSYFEAALSAICEAMNLKDDVAGATWMAAGGSAPELATSVLGVFVSKSDVGFGTIVGSAVFNVLFVIACCAFVAPNLKLTWWPLARDASYYCFSLAMIVLFISDDLKVKHYEAIILLLMYGGYVMIMYFNESLEVWVTARVKKSEDEITGSRKAVIGLVHGIPFNLFLYVCIITNSVMVFVELADENDRASDLKCWCGERIGLVDLDKSIYWTLNLIFNILFILEMLIKFHGYGFFGYWKIPLNCFDGSLVFLIVIEWVLENFAESQGIAIGSFRLLRILKFIRVARVLRMIRLVRAAGVGTESNQVMPAAQGEGQKTRQESYPGGEGGAKEVKDVEGATEVTEEEEEEDDDDPFDPFDVPDSAIGKFFWITGLPLAVGMWLTIPDCRGSWGPYKNEMFAKWWFATFAMCIVWIGALAFVMVWMVTEFGIQFEIRDSIMGLTLLAAGTSIPDCLSSVAVAKRGHGDMAVSSSIGSNIFDVLIGLPLPWFMYTAILNPAGAVDGPPDVPIISESLAVMILSLFVMVALVITTIHLSGWILSVKLGMMMMGLYCAFLALSLFLEFEVMLAPCDHEPFTNAELAAGFVIG